MDIETLQKIADNANEMPERNCGSITDVYELGVVVGKRELMQQIMEVVHTDAGGYLLINEQDLEDLL